jgi:hypothetical protein
LNERPVQPAELDRRARSRLLYRSFGIIVNPITELVMPKVTLIVLSDPANGEEALGRVFNALAAAYDFKRSNHPVQIVFQGTGTRWPTVLADPEHPAHGLYEAVADTVAGASAGCAAVFGATDDLRQQELPLITDNPVPGTPGLPSLVEYSGAGPVLTF